MLEQVDLSREISKEKYKEASRQMEIRLGELQREAKKLGFPVVVVFEGWDAAGKGTHINRLFHAFDPRGCIVVPTNPPNEEERLRPFLWRFWIKTPADGRIAVYDRSWYWKVLTERVDGIAAKREWKLAYNEITAFERQLADNGTLIIKFFLHISKNEQKRRFEKLQESKVTSWKVTEVDWKHHKQYNQYLEAIEEMLAKTDTDFSPWTIVEAENKHFATVKIFQTVIECMERKVAELENRNGKSQADTENSKAAVFKSSIDISSSVLEKVDLNLSLERDEYRQLLKKYQKRIFELEHEVYLKRIPVVILYEGWDAGGKGGNIRRLTRSMDPRGYEVIPVGAPDSTELSHHYMWRFWKEFPKAGHIAIYDRTWYGRVLVERIEGFCKETEWRRAYREINEVEEHMVNFGAVLVKFWIHIDKYEQLRRFKDREKRSDKQWKMTEEDWRNRDKWNDYKSAVDEMLFRTSTGYAPWTIVEGNSKYYARIKTIKTVIKAIEAKLK